MMLPTPYGTPDDSPYVNGDPSRGVQGSIPPAAAFEQPQRELVGVIEKSGFTTSDTNLLQMAYAVRSQRMNYAIDSNPNSGLPNQITVAYDPPITQYHAGLTLHVRVKYTNVPGQVTIDAGAGRVPIRKMNNADVSEGELPVNCIATLIFDGTAFQLSNFSGGMTGQTDIMTVNIPFAVEQPPLAPGTIRVQFNPPLPQTPVAGDIIAVQAMQTQPGPTSMLIDNFPNPVPLLPNGGGDMLQGDIVAGDIVQFFFDGNALRFIPNPEISAPVTYTVGPSQQYPTVAAAMGALKRKVIGQDGYVTLKLSPTRFDGPIEVAHPSGDRIRIEGTLLNPTPVIWSDFTVVGNTPPLREQSRIANNNTMRTRFGTEITVNDLGINGGLSYGIRNNGAGRPLFKDLFICGVANQAPPALGPIGEWWMVGVQVEPGLGISLQNVTVSSMHVAFSVVGAASANGAFGYGCSHCGFSISGLLGSNNGGAFGNLNHGYLTIYGATTTFNDRALGNGVTGAWAASAGGHQFWFGEATTNGVWDLQASDSASIVIVDPSNVNNNRLSPPLNVPGNNNATISRTTHYRPPT